MISNIIFVIVSITSLWFLAARFFRYCDVVVCRRRLHGHHLDKAKRVKESVPHRNVGRSLQLLEAHHFNELARLTRAHVPPRDALLSITAHSSETWRTFTHHLNSTTSLESLLQTFSEKVGDGLTFQLLHGSMSSGTLIPAALEHAATAVRDQQRTKGEIEVAATQARFTMKVLTWTPFVVLFVLLGLSDSFRAVALTPGVLVVIGIAIALNRTAGAWASRLVVRLSRRSPVDEILDVITVLSVHIRAGHSLPSACLQLGHVNPLGQAISAALQNGASFDDALKPFIQHGDPFGATVTTLLMSAYRDGQPAVELIGVLSHEARQLRDQHTQSRIRKLPTQLSAPVVLCALPAFILLVVVPMFLSQINTLSASLQSVSS